MDGLSELSVRVIVVVDLRGLRGSCSLLCVLRSVSVRHRCLLGCREPDPIDSRLPCRRRPCTAAARAYPKGTFMRIRHPWPEPGRLTFLDIEFVDGVAEVMSLHRERRLALEQHGFTIDETEANLARLSKPALLALAASNNVTVPPRATAKVIREILAELTPASSNGAEVASTVEDV